MALVAKDDYDAIAQSMVLLESALIKKNNTTKKLSKGYIILFKDFKLDIQKLRKALEKSNNTKNDYITSAKMYINIGNNFLTRTILEKTFVADTSTDQIKIKNSYRLITYDTLNKSEYSFIWYIIYFNSQKKIKHSSSIAINNGILPVDKTSFSGVSDFNNYDDFVNPDKPLIFSPTYGFDFADCDYYPGQLERDIRVLHMQPFYIPDYANIKTYLHCDYCDKYIFNKFYVINDKCYCKICAHLGKVNITLNDTIYIADSNIKHSSATYISAKDLDFLDMYDFNQGKIYYENDKYLLYTENMLNYFANKQQINPKNKQVILISNIIDF